ncbi:MAG TPA: hypothetical protein VHT51_09555 [Micropepsaceae bacterium]|nr:hypothetical protein [Micropepsaceae bacterium]
MDFVMRTPTPVPAIHLKGSSAFGARRDKAFVAPPFPLFFPNRNPISKCRQSLEFFQAAFLDANNGAFAVHSATRSFPGNAANLLVIYERGTDLPMAAAAETGKVGRLLMRIILLAAGAAILAGCTTPNINSGNQQQAAGTAEPRTPEIFRKPPKQVGHWGNGVGYGSRY